VIYVLLVRIAPPIHPLRTVRGYLPNAVVDHTTFASLNSRRSVAVIPSKPPRTPPHYALPTRGLIGPGTPVLPRAVESH
jgi:hypothetical protein